jgi:hypothetical protein
MLPSAFYNFQDAAAQLVDTQITAAADGKAAVLGGAPLPTPFTQ